MISTSDIRQIINEEVMPCHAEELVRQTRLKAIEKEHRSIGSILDHRELYPVEDVPIVDVVLAKAEINRRNRARRHGKYLSKQDEVDQLISELSHQTINQDIKQDTWEVEDQILRARMRDPSYIRKRRYEDAEIHQFRMNLTPDQKLEFKDLIKEALHDLARKCQKDLTAMKSTLDAQGVFHPEVNAHRVHCAYLLKLYKGIQVETLEHAALRKLKINELMRKNLQLDKDSNANEMTQLASMNVLGKAAKERFFPNAQKRFLKPLYEPRTIYQTEKSKAIRMEEGKEIVTEMRKSSSMPTNLQKQSKTVTSPINESKPPNSMIQAHKSKSSSSLTMNLKHVQSRPHLPRQLSSPRTPSANAQNRRMTELMGTRSIQGDKTVATEAQAPDKVLTADWDQNKALFQKIQRCKLGPADPRGILKEEAARLEKSEVHDIPKKRELSGVFDTEIADWMMKTLQFSQIDRASWGGESTTTAANEDPLQDIVPEDDLMSDEAILGLEAMKSELLIEKQRRILTGSTRTTTGAARQKFNTEEEIPIEVLEREDTRDNHDPDIVTFPDFATMFNEYLADKAKKLLKTSHQQTDHNMTYDDDLNGRHYNDQNGSLDNTMMNDDHLRGLNQAPRKKEVFERGNARQQSDLIQLLLRKEKHFDLFLRMYERDRETGKGVYTMPVPKKVSKLTPSLGKAALDLSAISSKLPLSQRVKYNTTGMVKGFKNHFLIDATTVPSDVTDRLPDATERKKLEIKEIFNYSDDETSQSGDERSRESTPVRSPRTSFFHHSSKPGVIAMDADDRSLSRTVTLPSSDQEASLIGRTKSQSKPSSRHKKGTARKSRADTKDDIMFNSSHMQDKLILMWDTLQVPAYGRLEFMEKYSSTAYALELNAATDMWSEVATLVLARLQVLQLMYKFKQGYCVMPISSAAILDPFHASVPSLFTSKSRHLIPQTHHATVSEKDHESRKSATIVINSTQSEPLSAMAFHNVNAMVHQAFAPCHGIAEDEATAETCLTSVGRSIDDLIHHSCQKIFNEIEDVVTFKDMICKDWINNETYW